MPGQPVAAAETFYYGLKTEYTNAYTRHYDGIKEEMSPCMAIDLPSGKDDERYAYYKSAPHIVRKTRGVAMPYKNFQSVSWTVENLEWVRGVEWYYTDRQDDQLKDLVPRAREVGQSYGILDERVFFQIVTGATDRQLLEAIPTAPDGQAPFATTRDGSNARFGATSGNLLTGTGVATPEAIRTDFFSMMAQFKLFEDTEGQPLMSPFTVDRSVIRIYFGASNQKVFGEAFAQDRSSIGTTTNAGNVAASNVVKALGFNVRLIATSRITDDDWFGFLEASPVKPVFSQLRMAPIDAFATWDNSDRVRETGYESLIWTARKGYGVGEPYGMQKVNN